MKTTFNLPKILKHSLPPFIEFQIHLRKLHKKKLIYFIIIFYFNKTKSPPPKYDQQENNKQAPSHYSLKQLRTKKTQNTNKDYQTW